MLAAVGDGEELLRRGAQARPDAVLTDIRMPPGHHMEGIEAAHKIRAEHPGVGVVVLSQHTEPAYAYALLSGTAPTGAGLPAQGSAVGTSTSWSARLREVGAGGSVIDPAVVDALVARHDPQRPLPLAALSPRERDVLREMAQGRTNAGIEQALHLSGVDGREARQRDLLEARARGGAGPPQGRRRAGLPAGPRLASE